MSVEDLQEQAGQVAALGDVEEHGMIRALGQGGEHPHRDSGIARGVAADLLEERWRDVVRAGERREDPARLEEPERRAG